MSNINMALDSPKNERYSLVVAALQKQYFEVDLRKEI